MWHLCIALFCKHWKCHCWQWRRQVVKVKSNKMFCSHRTQQPGTTVSTRSGCHQEKKLKIGAGILHKLPVHTCPMGHQGEELQSVPCAICESRLQRAAGTEAANNALICAFPIWDFWNSNITNPSALNYKNTFEYILLTGETLKGYISVKNKRLIFPH